jgi:chromate transporter
MILLKLFLSFLKVGFFVFGGGYAMLPMIQTEVTANNWLTTDQFMDGIVLGNSLPGPLAINMSTYTGYKVAGIPGAFLATVGICLPAFVLTILGAYLLIRFKDNQHLRRVITALQPAVVALIAVALFTVTRNATYWTLKSALLALVSFIILLVFKVNPLYIIVGCGLIGYIIF